uniref:Uncharacterized protein n=1 Tax=Cacopsylla melanoneura TaxID=428564 RepID=A0A8D9BNB6_9HEMI
MDIFIFYSNDITFFMKIRSKKYQTISKSETSKTIIFYQNNVKLGVKTPSNFVSETSFSQERRNFQSKTTVTMKFKSRTLFTALKSTHFQKSYKMSATLQ